MTDNLSRKGEGYLMIDHRASPGLPEDIARKTGLDPKYCGEGKLYEAATLTCSHCKCAFLKNPLRTREREKCSKCGWHYVCDVCAAEMKMPGYSHLPFEKLVDISADFFATGNLGTLLPLLTAQKSK
jgi:hypothetical protein